MSVWFKRIFVFICGIAFVFLALFIWDVPGIPDMAWTIQWQQLLNNRFFSQNQTVSAEKWIVITTRSHPTPEVTFLANIPGWKLVVVGDELSPKTWRLTNCIYLSIEDQRGLGFEIEGYLPLKSYARKAIGYLFAISHGAKVIYETDDDYQSVDLFKLFVLNKTMWGLSYKGNGLFNPYRHFGQLGLRPRGYPLSTIRETLTSNYKLDYYKTPSIQQGGINGHPDIDDLNLRENLNLSYINVMFDKRAPPAIVPAGVFSPFNSKNTLFLYDALWALLIPTTVTHHVCDIWRGYWAQRLLWEIGGNIGFFPSNVFHKESTNSYTIDIHDNKYVFQADKIISFLTKWKCKPERSFFDCMIQLSSDMVQNTFWNESDKLMAQSWVRDLKASGYKEPPRVPFGSLTLGVRVIERKPLSKESRPSQVSTVTFVASKQTPLRVYNGTSLALIQSGESRPITPDMTQIISSCGKNLVNISLLSPVTPHRTFPNILLIIVFNFPHYGNIPFLEAMYRMYFPQIIYCGPNHKTFTEHAKHMKLVSFIEFDIYKGWFAQNCLTQAMKMNYDVDGYLYIGDDTLLNVWNLHKQPWDKLWLVDGLILIPPVKINWIWIKDPHVGLLRYYAARNASQYLDKDRFKKFFSTLATNTGGKENLIKGPSDIAYVPKHYKEDVLYFMEHFSRFNLFVEITIPTVFHGLVLSDKIYKMPGMYLWYDGKRNHYEKYFNSSSLFLHPVKISLELKTVKGKSFFCKSFLPLLYHTRK